MVIVGIEQARTTAAGVELADAVAVGVVAIVPVVGAEQAVTGGIVGVVVGAGIVGKGQAVAVGIVGITQRAVGATGVGEPVKGVVVKTLAGGTVGIVEDAGDVVSIVVAVVGLLDGAVV